MDVRVALFAVAAAGKRVCWGKWLTVMFKKIRPDAGLPVVLFGQVAHTFGEECRV